MVHLEHNDTQRIVGFRKKVVSLNVGRCRFQQVQIVLRGIRRGKRQILSAVGRTECLGSMLVSVEVGISPFGSNVHGLSITIVPKVTSCC